MLFNVFIFAIFPVSIAKSADSLWQGDAFVLKCQCFNIKAMVIELQNGGGDIGVTTYKYRPFGQTMLEKLIVLLIALNIIGPFIDPLHPTGRLWDGVIFLIGKWIDMIGWVMGWFTPFLPRATSLQGTGQLLLSTVISLVIIVAAYLILSWFYKKILHPYFKQAGVYNSLKSTSSHVVFQSLLLLALLALWLPSILRLFSNSA